MKWQRLWGLGILDGVGSTEMLPIFLSNAPADLVYGTSGNPVPGYVLRLVDEDSAEVGHAMVGSFWCAAPRPPTATGTIA